MNKNQLQGQWEQLKGSAREQWGKLTNDDLSEINGEFEQLAGRIQERYGIAKEDAREQINEWMSEHK